MDLLRETKTDNASNHIIPVSFFTNGDDTDESTFNAPITDLARFINQFYTEYNNTKINQAGVVSTLNDEVNRATQAESDLQNAINSEILRATSAEQFLMNSVNSLELTSTINDARIQALEDNVGQLQTDLTLKVYDADGNQLQQSIIAFYDADGNTLTYS